MVLWSHSMRWCCIGGAMVTYYAMVLWSHTMQWCYGHILCNGVAWVIGGCRFQAKGPHSWVHPWPFTQGVCVCACVLLCVCVHAYCCLCVCMRIAVCVCACVLLLEDVYAMCVHLSLVIVVVWCRVSICVACCVCMRSMGMRHLMVCMKYS